MFTMQLREYH
ncbi:UNVERIFIED_CONTAM: hypothetical protein GTU68_023490 [Idotea baltica]|nr:hypothetical protein [Idotea baltica]